MNNKVFLVWDYIVKKSIFIFDKNENGTWHWNIKY